MYRMEGFYPPSFNLRETRKLLIFPVYSVSPNNSACTFNSVESEVISYTAGAAKTPVTHVLCCGQHKPQTKNQSLRRVVHQSQDDDPFGMLRMGAAFDGCPRVTGWEAALHHLGRAMQMGTDVRRAGGEGSGTGR